MNTSLLEAALAHHAAGRRVIPTRPNKAPDCRAGWSRWFSKPQTETEVRELFKNGVHGLGLILYPASPIVIIDFDGPHAEEAWKTTRLDLNGAGRVLTPSGGIHFVFRTPASTSELDKLKRKVRLVKASCDCENDHKPKPCGVDLLVNGYGIAPPTPGYSEDPDYPINSAVEIPSEIISFALSLQRSHLATVKSGDAAERVLQGSRHQTLVSIAGAMRGRGMSVDAIRAALIAENEKRFDPPVGRDEIENVLKSAAKWNIGRSFKPRRRTDLGNAERFVDQHQQDVRYCSQLGWLVWTGRCWEVDAAGKVERRAKQSVRQIYNEAANSENEEDRKALAEWAAKSESASRIGAMIELAKSESGIPINHGDLDRDPWLLNVGNGTLHLKAGKLNPHRHDDLITKIVDVEFDETAQCPTWEKFLTEITCRNEGQKHFLQMAVGYSLTGITSEQVFFILHGPGANGANRLSWRPSAKFWATMRDRHLLKRCS